MRAATGPKARILQANDANAGVVLARIQRPKWTENAEVAFGYHSRNQDFATPPQKHFDEENAAYYGENPQWEWRIDGN